MDSSLCRTDNPIRPHFPNEYQKGHLHNSFMRRFMVREFKVEPLDALLSQINPKPVKGSLTAQDSMLARIIHWLKHDKISLMMWM